MFYIFGHLLAITSSLLGLLIFHAFREPLGESELKVVTPPEFVTKYLERFARPEEGDRVAPATAPRPKN